MADKNSTCVEMKPGMALENSKNLEQKEKISRVLEFRIIWINDELLKLKELIKDFDSNRFSICSSLEEIERNTERMRKILP